MTLTPEEQAELASLEQMFGGLTSAPKVDANQLSLGRVASAGQGLFGGFLDEASAGYQSLAGYLGAKSSGNSIPLSDIYNEQLAKNRGGLDEYKQADPTMSTGLDVLGSILSPINKLNPMKNVGLLKQVGNAAFQGGIFGAGNAEGNENIISDTLLGGGLSGGTTGIVGGLGKVASTMTRPFTQGGREVLAGKELLENAGISGKAKLQGLVNGTVPSSGKYGDYSYAEIAGTPEASSFQQAMRKEAGEGATALENLLSNRQESRVSALKGVAPDSFSNTTQSMRGAEIQSLADDVVGDAWKNAGDPYSLIDKKLNIPVQKAKHGVGSLKHQLYKDASLPIGTDTQRIVDNFLVKDKEMSIGKLLSLKSESGRIIGELQRSNPKSADIRLLGGLRSKIDDSIENAMHEGVIPAKQKNIIEKATENYAFTGTKFGNKLVKNIVTRGGLDAGAQLDKTGQVIGRGFKTPPESVINKILQSEDNARNWRMAFGDDPDLMNLGKEALLDKMSKQTPATWNNFFKKNKGVFKEVFWNEQGVVDDVLKDLGLEHGVQELSTRASKGQSATAQFLNSAKKIETQGTKGILRGLGTLAGGGASGAIGFGLGGPVGALLGVGGAYAAKNAGQKLQTLLSKSLSDPQLVKQLVEKGINPRYLGQSLAPKAGQVVRSLMAESGNQEEEQEQFTNTEISEAPKINTPVAQSEPTNVKDLISKYSAGDPVFAKLIQAESAGKHDAISRVGAIGLTQVMPKTGQEVLTELFGEKISLEETKQLLRNPEINLIVGKYYFDKQRKAVGGDDRLALAAYNAGLGAVRKYKGVPPFKETQDYVKKILG